VQCDYICDNLISSTLAAATSIHRYCWAKLGACGGASKDFPREMLRLSRVTHPVTRQSNMSEFDRGQLCAPTNINTQTYTVTRANRQTYQGVPVSDAL